MQFTTTRKEFLAVLEASYMIVPDGEDGSLSYLLISQSDTQLTILASNGMTTYQGLLTVDGDKTAEHTVPARALHAGVKGMPEGRLEIHVHENQFKVKHEEAELKLRLGMRGEFPTLFVANKDDDAQQLSISIAEFTEAWQQVVYATNIQDSRIALGCVAISAEGYFVATDSHRLAMRSQVPLLANDKDIVHPVPVRLGNMLLTNAQGRISISRQGPYLILRADNIYLAQIGVPTAYPDWRPLTELDGVSLSGQAGAWLAAVKGASIFAGKINPLRLQTKEEGLSELEFYTEGIGSGSMARSVQIANPHEWHGRIYLNAQYVRDVLARLEDVEMVVTDQGPVKFQAGADQHLIMPMRMED